MKGMGCALIVAENVRAATFGELLVSGAPEDVLVAYGLGSCVAVYLYNPRARVGGLLHALLPYVPAGQAQVGNPAKFVDLGVPLLIEALLSAGATRTCFAYLCGGARILDLPGAIAAGQIGARNIIAAEAALDAAGIPITARSVGGRVGVTTRLWIASGRMTVKAAGQPERIIAKGEGSCV